MFIGLMVQTIVSWIFFGGGHPLIVTIDAANKRAADREQAGGLLINYLPPLPPYDVGVEVLGRTS